MEILTVKNLSFSYPNSEEPVLKDISLSVRQGELLLLCGASGSGKTTLLKMLKREISPHGKRTGEILYKNKSFAELSDRDSARKIGFVFQNPEHQLVTDKVWHELAFGLESLGYDSEHIRLRVGETAGYFGMSPIFRRDTDTLSGGQKQMVCLASVMAMSPEVLILDEPTSMLDPISAGEFIHTIKRLNSELGLTIIITEHRLQEIFPVADRVAVLENGRLLTADTPKLVCEQLKENKISLGFPTAVRIGQASKHSGDCPLTVKEGRSWLETHYKPSEIPLVQNKVTKTVLTLKNISFRYEKNSPEVLRNVSFELREGEHFCLLGANGSGKTTLLKLIAGSLKCQRGRIKTEKKRISLLPQSPEVMFIADTVGEDLSDFASAEEINHTAQKLGIAHLLSRHPYDISMGELQRCALAKLLLSKPDIILMDEPAKGLDAENKISLGKIISELRSAGITVLTVTHDVEFAAEYADRCGLFFDGELLTVAVPQEFFSVNDYYTTAASRIARGRFVNAVTAQQVTDEIRRQEANE